MIRPICSHDALLADIRASDKRDSNFRLWWLGQSGFLLQWQGVHVLLDPYLSDSLTKKYSQTDKPHVRMTELVIDPAQLSFVDVVTSSHNHTDHLDAETLVPILAGNPRPKLVIAESNRAFVADRLSIDPTVPIGVDDGTVVEVSGIRFSGWLPPTKPLSATSRVAPGFSATCCSLENGWFTTAATRSGTRTWRKSSSPSECASHCSPSMAARLKEG